MKNKILLLSALICLSITSCTTSFSQSSSSSVNNSSDSQSKSSDSNPPKELKTNYQRITKVQEIVGEMSEKIASTPGDIKKSKIRNQYNGKFEYHDWSVMPMEEPEIKSLTEPLSMAFAILEHYIQNEEPNYPIFDKTFYTKTIKDEETHYQEYFKIRDYPSTSEKMIYIQYWSNYHNLIHIDENGHFSMISEYPYGRHPAMTVDDEQIGNGEDFMVQLDLQADGHRFSTIFATSDYENDIPDIINHFYERFAKYETVDNKFELSKMLLQYYFDLFKKEDGTYDRSDILKPDLIELGENDVLIDDKINDLSSYLSIPMMQNAFMENNYVNVNHSEDNLWYEINNGKLLHTNTHLNLYDIPKTITEIDGLLIDPNGLEEDDNTISTGCALFIPSNVKTINDGALNNSKSQHISHIFVEYSKNDCPFINILNKLENAIVLFKEEYQIINNIPVPKAPHDLGEQ